MVKKAKIKTQVIRDVLFYVAYFLIFINATAGRIGAISNYARILLFIAISSLFICFILSFNKKRTKLFIVNTFLLIISFISYTKINDPTFLLLFLLISSSETLSFRKFITVDFIVRLISTSIITLLGSLGVISSLNIVHHEMHLTSLGFSHPNVLGFYTLILFAEWVYLFAEKKIQIISSSILFALLVYININFTGCETAVIIASALLIYCFISNHKINKLLNVRSLRLIVCNIFAALFLVTAVTSQMYKNGDATDLNSFTSGRLRFNSNISTNYPISPFGQIITFVSNEQSMATGAPTLILDNMYYSLLFTYGGVLFVVFYLFTVKIFNKAYKDNDYYIIVIFTFLLIYGLFETHPLQVQMNPFLLFISMKSKDEVVDRSEVK